MSNTDFPKAGIYFSHYECMGHFSRVMAIGEVYKKRFPQGSLFFIQAGLEQRKAKIEELGRVYQLPWPFLSRRNFKDPVHLSEINASGRSQKCTEIVSQESPQLFITELFPLGREESRFELIPALAKLSSQGSRLWSVAGYPLLTGHDEEWREKVLNLYQRIFIFSPPIEKEYIANALLKKSDKQKYLDFFEKNAAKITFTGYFLPKQPVVYDDQDRNLVRPPVPANARSVVVVRGGGAYHTKLIVDALSASDSLGMEYYWTVVAGPSTTPQEWYLFSMLVGKKKLKNLVLLRSAGDYEELIAKSDICISAAPYHTASMLLKYRKKAVVVPLKGSGTVGFSEQLARAHLLKDVLGAEVLSIDELTPDRLAAAVKNRANSHTPVSSIEEQWFNGGEAFDKALTEMCNDRPN